MYLYVDTSNMCHVAAHSLSDEQLRNGANAVVISVAHEIAKAARVYGAKRVYFFCDSKVGSWRKKVFPEYKAQRQIQLDKGDPAEKFKHDLADKAAKEVMLEFIPLLSCPVFVFPYLEADDLCAAASLINFDKETVILTSDKDYWQLVNPMISIHNSQHHYSIKMGPDGKLIKEMSDRTVEHLNLTPVQHLMTKTLMGDNSDNIPGLVGCGEVTAYKVIQEGRMLTYMTEETGMVKQRKSKNNPNPVPFHQDAIQVVNRNLMLMTLTKSQVIDKAQEIVRDIQTKGLRGFENNFTRLSLWIETKGGHSPEVSREIAKILSDTFQGTWVQ